VLDLTGKGPGDETPADIEAAARRLGGYRIKPLDIVLLRTDAAKRLEKSYLTDHPGMTKEAVHWLLDRGVKVMGIDAIGFDPPVAKMFERRKFWEAHRVMREREYYHLENLCNLHEIPPPFHSFIVSVLPVKWRGASAAPVRAVAILSLKLATFEIPTPAGPVRRIGAAVDGRLIDFAAAYAAYLHRTDPGCDAERLADAIFPHGALPRRGRAGPRIGAARDQRGGNHLRSVRRPHDVSVYWTSACSRQPRLCNTSISLSHLRVPTSMKSNAAWTPVSATERGAASRDTAVHQTLQFIRWRAATIWRTMRRLALRNDAVESRAGGRRERLAGGA
jgi:hypothetical protein